MALMKRANREIIVPEHLVGEYLDKGYSLIDDKGTILKDSNPQNVELKNELDSLRAAAPAESKKPAAKAKES